MRNGVMWPVGRKQETLLCNDASVDLGGGPELEKMERRQSCNEEWRPPDWTRCEE